MPRTHAPYPPEFRRQMVELVRSGRSVEGLAREFERSSPDLCVKAEEAPRLRLGCLGDLLFLEE